MTLRRKETVRTLVVGFESSDEFRADLIRRLGDAGAERGADPIDPRPEPRHRGDRRFDDPAKRALPAGVRGADHARSRVGEQDHAAIGAGDAEAEAGRRGDQRVATRPRVAARRARRPPARRGNGPERESPDARARSPSAAAMRARLSRTASGASREPTPPLSEA